MTDPANKVLVDRDDLLLVCRMAGHAPFNVRCEDARDRLRLIALPPAAPPALVISSDDGKTPDPELPCTHPARQVHGQHEWYIDGKRKGAWVCRACGARKQEATDYVAEGDKQ